MDQKFTFDTLTNDQVWGYMREGYVFNTSKSVLRKKQVIQNTISNKDFGSSGQIVDIYVPVQKHEMNIAWVSVDKYVSLSDCFTEDTDSGSGVYDLSVVIDTLDQNRVEYMGILIITRTKSEFLFDGENKYKVFSEYYSICSEQCGLFLDNHPNISGFLTKNRLIVFSIDDLRSVIEQEDTQEHSLSDYLRTKYLKEIREYCV